MFDDILMATCQREFEAKVKKLFELNQQSGKKTCEVPYLGGPYCTDVGGDHAGLQQRVVDALIARKRFEWTGPDCVDELPLRSEAINVLEEDADPRLRLVALYAELAAPAELGLPDPPGVPRICSRPDGLRRHAHGTADGSEIAQGVPADETGWAGG